MCQACWHAVRTLRAPCCRVCGDELPTWRDLDEVCSRCVGTPTPLDRARGAAVYDGALRHIIHAFKYEGRRSLAAPLGALLLQAGHDVLTGATCTIPVPLFPVRRLARGFNQARDLARRLPLPVVSCLWRTRHTTPQEHLGAEARRRNVHGVFCVSPLLPARIRSRVLDGQVVVLVDDVRTTGSTLEQCAAVLKAAGAREVRALTVAIAPRRQARA